MIAEMSFLKLDLHLKSDKAIAIFHTADLRFEFYFK